MECWIGATETVGSLEALEALMDLRSRMHGISEPVEVFTGPSARKPFRFGNGGIQVSSSYVMVPQRLGDQLVSLGLYTIDAEKVPILMEKMGALIDVCGRWLVLSSISPEVKIPLAKSRAGHLLVNLTMDWLNVSQPLNAATRAAYTAHCRSNVLSHSSFSPCGHVHEASMPICTSSSTASCKSCVVEKVWMIEDEIEGEDFPEESIVLMSEGS